MMVRVHVTMEEGRAASKSPHKNLAIFLLSQQAVSADIFLN
jgi:hypothetical protein